MPSIARATRSLVCFLFCSVEVRVLGFVVPKGVTAVMRSTLVVRNPYVVCTQLSPGIGVPRYRSESHRGRSTGFGGASGVCVRMVVSGAVGGPVQVPGCRRLKGGGSGVLVSVWS